jgi:chromate reductase, NAD(P)H dehydrogenase (quinone)
MSARDCPSLNVLVVGASLRRESLNNRLAALAAQAVQRTEAGADITTIADFECPSYDGDVEVDSGIPGPAREFCRRLRSADALMIASPEYNASFSGALKNVIDWVSRFRPQPFNGKQVLLMSASPAMAGGNRGVWSLRVALEHLGARVYPDMFSLAQAHQAFGPDGRIANDVLQTRFDDTIGCFLELVEAAKHYPTLKKQWVEFLGERPDAAIDRVETSEVTAA